jgi:hypothetical protein
MSVLEKFRPYWNETRLLSLIDRVTARAQTPVWQRVQDRLPSLGVHEARGYIRARAALVIEQEMAIALAEEPSMRPPQVQLVAQTVRHRVVRRLLFETLRQQTTTRTQRRRAA